MQRQQAVEMRASLEALADYSQGRHNVLDHVQDVLKRHPCWPLDVAEQMIETYVSTYHATWRYKRRPSGEEVT